MENDVSPFELNHSGVLSALSKYLISATTDLQPPRKLRLKRFAAVFMSLDVIFFWFLFSVFDFFAVVSFIVLLYGG